MTQGDVHTVHRDGKWRNEIEGGQRASYSADTKAEAQSRGGEMAQERNVEHHFHKLCDVSWGLRTDIPI